MVKRLSYWVQLVASTVAAVSGWCGQLMRLICDFVVAVCWRHACTLHTIVTKSCPVAVVHAMQSARPALSCDTVNAMQHSKTHHTSRQACITHHVFMCHA